QRHRDQDRHLWQGHQGGTMKRFALWTAAVVVVVTASKVSADPAIRVTASYPDASAPVVQDTVGVPLERTLLETDGVAHVWTECRRDGSAALTAYLKPRTDATRTAIRLRNIGADVPLPDLVRGSGVEVQAEGPGRRLVLWVRLTSRDRNATEL